MYYFRLGSFVKDCDNSELHAVSLKARKVQKTCVSDVAKLKIWQFVYKPWVWSFGTYRRSHKLKNAKITYSMINILSRFVLRSHNFYSRWTFNSQIHLFCSQLAKETLKLYCVYLRHIFEYIWQRLTSKAPPNDSNMSTQHIATLLVAALLVVWPVCWTLDVATCWVLLAQIWKWSHFSCNICGCCMILWSFGQVHAIMLSLGMRTSLIFNTQHVATGWPNACNMLRPTMLRYVAFKCCDRLARALACNEMLGQQCWDMLCWNVAIVWPELANAGPTMLRNVVLKCCDRLAGA